MNQGQALLSILSDCITDNNTAKLEEICLKLPLGEVSIEASDLLLSQLLNICSHYNRVECSRVIYSVWEQSNLEEEKYSLLAYMMSKPLFTDDVIRLTAHAKGDVTFKDLFDQITSRDDSPETLHSLKRLFEIFGTPDYNTLLEMKAQIEQIEEVED